MNLLNTNEYGIGQIVDGKVVTSILCLGEWFYEFNEDLSLSEIAKNYKSKIGKKLENGDVIIGEIIEDRTIQGYYGSEKSLYSETKGDEMYSNIIYIDNI